MTPAFDAAGLADHPRRRADQHRRRVGQRVNGDAAEERSQAQKHRRQVDRERAVPLLKSHLVQRDVVGRPQAGVGDEDFDRAEAQLDLGEQAVDVGLQRQVGAQRHARRPQLARQLRRAVAVLAEVGDDAGALADERADHLAADAAGGAGHQDDAVG
jgi:hypothetical protein